MALVAPPVLQRLVDDVVEGGVAAVGAGVGVQAGQDVPPDVQVEGALGGLEKRLCDEARTALKRDPHLVQEVGRLHELRPQGEEAHLGGVGLPVVPGRT